MGDDAVVTLDIVKRSGENIIETAGAVKAAVEAMRPTFPPTTTVSITADQSKQIVMMVSALENNIVSGLVLIVGVLLFFLGLRTSIFVAISIPTSMLLSFIVLYYMGVTLNMIVLFSLILALGMLVDNAIVVVENIYRFLEQGWERTLAVKKAVGEVALPIISSTATTLAAFLPLLFWPGEVGEFMGYLPITLIVTLTSSLFVALTIVPTICSMYIQLEGAKPEPLRPAMKWTLVVGAVIGLALIARANALTAGLLIATGAGLWALHHWVLDRLAYRFRTDTVTRIIAAYERTTRWALGHRAATVGMTAATFVAIATIFGITHSDRIEYFPESMPPAQLLVDVETPVGTRAAVTDSIVMRIEQELAGVGGRKDWESVVSVTGGAGGGAGAAMMGGGGPSGPETGRVTVSLIDFQDRDRDAFETLAEMQEGIGRDVAGAEITVGQASQGPPAGAPVSIEIVGEDPEVLQALSDEALQTLENAAVSRMLTGLESDLDVARPEVSVSVDREKAALYDLNTFEVGNAIRGAINGVEAAKYRTGNDEYDIIVRLAEPYRQELEGLRELTVMAEGTQVPLVSVATWSVQEGAGSIRRKDQQRMATITSDAAAGYANNQVLAEVQATLADFASSLPPGYTIQYTGQSQEQAEAQEFLSGAFMIALMLIALILISQFNSVVKPFVILTSVLMSTMGVLVGLMMFQMPFGIINTGIGIISLAGVVVNNAIILIDYIGTLRGRDGLDRREALVLAGKTRFRPVILTAVTTALGLVTLAIGLNFDFFGLYRELNPDFYWGGEQAAWWGPMCVAIIAGILLATFLTLVLVPVMYSIADDAEELVKKYFVRQEREPARSEVAVARG
jgi:multidrug efflux pump subunit AcrB